MGEKYDFSAWATKNDLRCADGRIIRRDAFIGNDGQVVPLVWNHQHDGPGNVVGHALLENRPEGVKCYGSFNNTQQGMDAHECVKHGDIKSVSIYANHLKQRGSEVVHGVIREVSLVLAGANPGACIIDVIEHSDEDDEFSATIFNDNEDLSYNLNQSEEQELKHVDADPEEKEGEKKDAMANEKEKTVQDVIDSMSEEQKTAMYFLIAKALEEAGVDVEKSDEGDEEVKHNVFEGEYTGEDTLSHSEMEAIFSEAKRSGSLKEAVLSHDDVEVTYGVKDIDWLFPEPKNQNVPPQFLTRDMDWVSVVMNGVHHSPFSRIKSMFANLTEDEARAKGYLKKGTLKKEQVFSLLKRSTSPTTVYKKQKLDRDDVTDITDFDIVAWIKKEMRMMLDEELARAFLVGDGRLDSDDDKISEDHVRPIWKEAPLFVVNATFQQATGAGAEYTDARSFIVAAVRSRKDYKGSGNPILFTTEDMLTSMLLLEDNTGRELYKDESDIARKLRVSRIVTVPVMENLTREVSGVTRNLAGIIVNLNDYNVGADKGGAINMFDDFDIDYNQMKYLIETRCSGALVKPYSAIIIESVAASSAPSEEAAGEE